MKKVNALYLVVAIATITMMALAFNVSSSGDEPTQAKIGDNILKFYETWGKDSTALKPVGIDQWQYYGSSFDTFCQFVVQIFSLDDQYTFRHLMNALIGGLILLFIGLFGRLLKNDTVGIIAVVLAFFSPKLLGHSFNNPKDIPFALGYLMSLYFMAKWFMDVDKTDRKTIIFLILSIAFTNSIRIGGVLLYGYLGIFLLMAILKKSGLKNIFSYKKQIFTSAIVVIVSYFLGLILWPYGIVSPLKHPKEALAGFENVSIGIYQIFNGVYDDSRNLPATYLFKFILMTTPIIVFIGLAIFLWKEISDKTWRKNMIYSFLIFATIFPLAYIIYKDSNVYNGWRQVLFVYPPLVILSSLGIGLIFEKYSEKLTKYSWTFWPVLVLTLFHPISHIIRNHPYEYIYFNEASGGVKKAYGNYELDYYYHSNKEATLWLKDYIKKHHPATTDTILTASNNPNYSYYLRDEPRIKTSYILFYNRQQTDWEYYICFSSSVTPFQLKTKQWPPKGTIHTIDVDGKPICAIIKRPSHADYKAFALLSQNQFEPAITLYKEYLKSDSTNSAALASLANSYVGISQYDTCAYYANKSLLYYKNYPIGLDMLGRVYLSRNEFDKAIQCYAIIIKEKPNFHLAYYFQAIAYFQKKDYFSALKSTDMCLKLYPNFKPVFTLIGQIMQAQGNTSDAQYYFDRAK